MDCVCRKSLDKIARAGEGNPNMIQVRAFSNDLIKIAEAGLQGECRYAVLRQRLLVEKICPECLSGSLFVEYDVLKCWNCGREFNKNGVEQ